MGTLAIHIPNNNLDNYSNPNNILWKHPNVLFNNNTLRKSQKYIKKQICMRDKLVNVIENFTTKELWKQNFKEIQG